MFSLENDKILRMYKEQNKTKFDIKPIKKIIDRAKFEFQIMLDELEDIGQSKIEDILYSGIHSIFEKIFQIYGHVHDLSNTKISFFLRCLPKEVSSYLSQTSNSPQNRQSLNFKEIIKIKNKEMEVQEREILSLKGELQFLINEKESLSSMIEKFKTSEAKKENQISQLSSSMDNCLKNCSDLKAKLSKQNKLLEEHSHYFDSVKERKATGLLKLVPNLNYQKLFREELLLDPIYIWNYGKIPDLCPEVLIWSSSYSKNSWNIEPGSTIRISKRFSYTYTPFSSFIDGLTFFMQFSISQYYFKFHFNKIVPDFAILLEKVIKKYHKKVEKTETVGLFKVREFIKEEKSSNKPESFINFFRICQTIKRQMNGFCLDFDQDFLRLRLYVRGIEKFELLYVLDLKKAFNRLKIQITIKSKVVYTNYIPVDFSHKLICLRKYMLNLRKNKAHPTDSFFDHQSLHSQGKKEEEELGTSQFKRLIVDELDYPYSRFL